MRLEPVGTFELCLQLRLLHAFGRARRSLAAPADEARGARRSARGTGEQGAIPMEE